MFIADFHIHSHYSIATSKNLVPEYLDYWARIKGINVVGTGDCIHPGWLNELIEKLEDTGNGLFKLKDEYRIIDSAVSSNNRNQDVVYFVLTGEISNIYKKNDRVRKVHNLCIFPDFNSVVMLQNKLKEIGNIESDGRPIIGMDSKLLLEWVLESSETSFLVPAHIWTPWFSVLGSKSGFDNITECYEDLTPHIFAVETGLSSDPPMNWACSFLDKFKLISNSDAHSPEKLGREANLFDCEISYDSIYRALSGDKGFVGSIEFFPQEGKYHYDGHRKCNICWDPLETLENNGKCKVCGKPVTKGVMYRVAELADRPDIDNIKNTNDFYSITSLPDLISEIMSKGRNTKIVQKEYMRLVESIGPEFHILLNAELDEINQKGSELLAEGIKRLRNNEVIIDEGYDGEFGRIKVFSSEEISTFSGTNLFTSIKDEKPLKKKSPETSIKFDIQAFQSLLSKPRPGPSPKTKKPVTEKKETSNEQRLGIEHSEGPCMIIAGPGAGKTRILTERICHLVKNKNINPENILAITFSNKAAEEMRNRVHVKMPSVKINISTFHAFGLSILKEHHDKIERPEKFTIISNEEKREMIISFTNNKRGLNRKLTEIEVYKQGILKNEKPALFNDYEKELRARGSVDLSDLIYLPVQIFQSHPEVLKEYRDRYQWILADEDQDINSRQYEMLILLGGGNPNLFVIGDPDQSIYGFRGSDIFFIDKIQKDLKEIEVINLSKSYRCPDNILKAAGQILNKNKYLVGIPENRKIHIQKSETDKSEADWIAAQIEKMMGGVRSFSIDSGISDGQVYDDINSFSDFAVLCRTMAMFKPIVKAFEDHGVAYQVIGTETFYEREPVKSVVNIFRRIYFSKKNNTPPPDYEVLHLIQEMITGSEKISDIFKLMVKYNPIPTEDSKRLIKLSGIYDNDYEKFFNNISLRKGVDDYDNKSEAVSLMTIHASKGLEFNAVFIPGCEQGMIPFELFGKKNNNELEEEERLFYVGITRTLNYLYLSHAKKRNFRGKILRQKRSAFLDRVQKQLLHHGKRQTKAVRSDDIQMDLF